MKEYSREEKLDIIFDWVQQQKAREKREMIIRWSIRFVVVGGVYYLFQFAIPGAIENAIPELPHIRQYFK